MNLNKKWFDATAKLHFTKYYKQTGGPPQHGYVFVEPALAKTRHGTHYVRVTWTDKKAPRPAAYAKYKVLPNGTLERYQFHERLYDRPPDARRLEGNNSSVNPIPGGSGSGHLARPQSKPPDMPTQTRPSQPNNSNQ